jgi:hypothetical protein
MEHQYLTLSTLADAVKDLPNPTSYFCTPREMILRCSYDWATILQHLIILEEEQLVQMIDAENIQFAITKEGLRKAIELQELSREKNSMTR